MHSCVNASPYLLNGALLAGTRCHLMSREGEAQRFVIIDTTKGQ
jgi:hypothetical protein